MTTTKKLQQLRESERKNAERIAEYIRSAKTKSA